MSPLQAHFFPICFLISFPLLLLLWSSPSCSPSVDKQNRSHHLLRAFKKMWVRAVSITVIVSRLAALSWNLGFYSFVILLCNEARNLFAGVLRSAVSFQRQGLGISHGVFVEKDSYFKNKAFQVLPCVFKVHLPEAREQAFFYSFRHCLWNPLNVK